MPSLRIAYEICEEDSLLFSTEKITKVKKLRISSRKYIWLNMVVGINSYILMKEMLP